jgi:phosphoribosylaminoimidazole-succinocarboxamide synthase
VTGETSLAPPSGGALPRPIHSGKVRDLYDAGPGRLLMVASDRMSAFDVVLPTPIPDKGRILTALSLWWFDRLADLLPNHLITADVDGYPAPFTGRPELAGRSMLVRRLDMVMVECVARAYLSGSGTVAYRSTGRVCGVELPPGLTEGSRLPETIFTPTTKGGPTGHDEPMTFAEVADQVGAGLAERLRDTTIAVLERGRAVCEPRGILLADTKVEFGLDPGGAGDGRLILADEVLTPDSSRFWPADLWSPGRAQPSFDKQPLRDWLKATGWDRRPPGPELPDDVVAATRARYVAAYERITGTAWR